ncbi:MAG: hypothetical protein JW839_00100 [Candidatus Lokiarchaeota archaeon]|nr:hypothetical protein [Candidatus Lokiarchaeota archaeon]
MTWIPENFDEHFECTVIHDNFDSIRSYISSKHPKGDPMRASLTNTLLDFNGRYVSFHYGDVALVSTCMGSAQTNGLIERLSRKRTRWVIKIGTCSALDDRIQEGDIIIPRFALVDEGATYWRGVKKNNDLGVFNEPAAVRDYIEGKDVVECHQGLRRDLIEGMKHSAKRFNSEIGKDEVKIWDDSDICNPCVWSVDAYDCFDSSPELYSKVNGQAYSTKLFGGTTRHDVCIFGVEMECSALFSSSSSLQIPSAAIIIASRTRQRLLYNNIAREKRRDYNVPDIIAPRNVDRREMMENFCFDVAIDMLRARKGKP